MYFQMRLLGKFFCCLTNIWWLKFWLSLWNSFLIKTVKEFYKPLKIKLHVFSSKCNKKYFIIYFYYFERILMSYLDPELMSSIHCISATTLSSFQLRELIFTALHIEEVALVLESITAGTLSIFRRRDR